MLGLECTVPDEAPRLEFGRVRAAAFVVLVDASLELSRVADVASGWLDDAS